MREKIKTPYQALHLRIIDGGRSDSTSLQTDKIEITPDFVDKVMEKLDSEPRVLRDQEEATIIEFHVPKTRINPKENNSLDGA